MLLTVVVVALVSLEDASKNVFSVWLFLFMPPICFYTTWKYQKTTGFLMFSGGLETKQWHEMC